MERDLIDEKSCPNVENLFTWPGQMLANDEIPVSSDHLYTMGLSESSDLHLWYGIRNLKKSIG